METYPPNINDSVTTGLAKNVLNLGNEVRELTKQLAKAKRDFAALREAGDEAWYCYRHREPLAEAFEEWATARDGNYND